MNKFAKIALVASIGVFTGMSASAGVLNGTKWQSIDENGAKKAVIKFSESGGVVSGEIIKLNDRSRKGAVCTKCTGNLKNKKIEGLIIIWNLKADGANKWNRGKLVDPETGNVYEGSIKLNGNKLTLNGKKLTFRDYLGMDTRLSDRNQTWTKIK